MIEPNIIMVEKLAVNDSQLSFVLGDKKVGSNIGFAFKEYRFQRKGSPAKGKCLATRFRFITGDLLSEEIEDGISLS